MDGKKSNYKSKILIKSPEQLAKKMAEIAIQFRDQINFLLNYKAINTSLQQFFADIKINLQNEITNESISNVSAQILVYGLFSAKLYLPSDKNLGIAEFEHFIGLFYPNFQNLFREIINVKKKNSKKFNLIELSFSELLKIFNDSTFDRLISNFILKSYIKDPIIYFYELFISYYNPNQKIKRGIFYTPSSIVNFIIRSIDYILISDFSLSAGIADLNSESKLRFLDPAVGTGTFLYQLLKEIYSKRSNQNKDWNTFVATNILPNIFGFELTAVPYSIALLELKLLLKKWKYDFNSDQRVNLFLTDALDEQSISKSNYFGNSSISDHKNSKFLTNVILGNPPYSKFPQNKSKWIEKLMDDYREVDRERIKDKKIWLDDYTRFIRFSQWVLNRSKKGIIGFITSNGFLDAPTLRGMRYSLINDFNTIYIINLHGQIREILPEGIKDENVFDIKQGVSINLFIKNNVNNTKKIYYYDLWGNRESKYEFLSSKSINKIKFTEIKPISPFYILKPHDTKFSKEYFHYESITDIFEKHVSGIVTARDSFVTDLKKENLMERISEFLDKGISNDEIRNKYNLKDNYDWKLENARQKIKLNSPMDSYIKVIDYRLFDKRLIFYHPDVVFRPRQKFLLSMELTNNIAITTTRNTTSLEFNHVTITNNMIEMKFCSHDRNTYIFPLYSYDFSGVSNPFEIDPTKKDKSKKLNLQKGFIDKFEKKTGLNVIIDENKIYSNGIIPQDILRYICAIMHSTNYRKRYAEFLKPDFARIPIPSSVKLINQLIQFGKIIESLYLGYEQAKYIRKNPLKNKNEILNSVGFPKYSMKQIQLSKDMIIDDINEEIWDFKIGGYQVIKKWIQRRSKLCFDKDTVNLLLGIISTIEQLISIMKDIDNIIDMYGGWPIS